MGRLHRLLDNSEQRLAQLIQVHLMAQSSAEGSQRPCRIILAAKEAAINDLLETMAQRLAEGRDRQGGDDDGDAAVLADDAPQERLQANHQANVHQR